MEKNELQEHASMHLAEGKDYTIANVGVGITFKDVDLTYCPWCGHRINMSPGGQEDENSKDS